jgi:hypothetical protein
MKKGKWFYYWKKVQGRISTSDYIFIKEENNYIYTHEETHLSYCQDWAERVNKDGSNNGFEYGFDDIDSPPQEWIDKKILSTRKEIDGKTEYINLLNEFKK